jgi:DNA-directed RNA polymerase specialized sigma24 family protein
METMSLDVAGESTSNLMLWIGESGENAEDQQIAREALQELHKRCYAYVYAVVSKFGENLGTATVDPEAFALASFIKAFECAYQFQDRSDGDPERADHQVKAWLGRIAINLAKDELQRLSTLNDGMRFVVLEEAFDIPDTSNEVCDEIPTNPKALESLRDVLESLKAEE